MTFPRSPGRPSPSGGFATTHWTVVLQAQGPSPEAKSALAALCEAYYAPVRTFIRSSESDPQQCDDLTQEFFAQILAGRGIGGADPGRGRFRSYLLGAVKHFLHDMRDRDRAAKRGGGRSPEPLAPPGGPTVTSPGCDPPDPKGFPPDSAFDRAWALTLLSRCLTNLAVEHESAGKQEQFETLKPWLTGASPGSSQAEAAQRLGTTEGAVKVAVHRLRKRFRELIEAEISQTIDDPALIREELRYLIEAVS